MLFLVILLPQASVAAFNLVGQEKFFRFWLSFSSGRIYHMLIFLSIILFSPSSPFDKSGSSAAFSQRTFLIQQFQIVQGSTQHPGAARCWARCWLDFFRSLKSQLFIRFFSSFLYYFCWVLKILSKSSKVFFLLFFYFIIINIFNCISLVVRDLHWSLYSYTTVEQQKLPAVHKMSTALDIAKK